MNLLIRSAILITCFLFFRVLPVMSGTDEWRGWRGLDRQASNQTVSGINEWTSSKNVLWRIGIDGEGYSSPVVNGNSVFVTAARFKNGSLEINKVIIFLVLFCSLFVIILNVVRILKGFNKERNDNEPGLIIRLFQLSAEGLLAFCFCVICWMVFNESRNQGERILVSYLFSGTVTIYCMLLLIFKFPEKSVIRITGGLIAIVFVLFLLRFHPIPGFYFTRDFFRIENLWVFQLIVPGVILPLILALVIVVKPFVSNQVLKKVSFKEQEPAIEKKGRISIIMPFGLLAFFTGLSGFMAIPAISVLKWVYREELTRIQAPFALTVFFDPEYSYPFFLSVISLGFLFLFLITFKYNGKEPENGRYTSRAILLCSSLIFFIILNYSTREPLFTREVLCIDRYNGKIRWKSECETSPASSCSNYNSQATPTPLLDERNIYSYFGSAGLFCTDLNGRLRWKNRKLPFEAIHGAGGSPVFSKYGIVLLNSMAKNPYLTLVDRNTGSILWRHDLSPYTGVGGEYRTPVVSELNGQEVIIEWSTARAKIVIYDSETGSIICQYDSDWTVSGESVSTPAISGGILFLPNKSGVTAVDIIKLMGGEKPVIWKTYLDGNGPDTSSPVLSNGMIFMISDNGDVTCLNAETGKVIWQEKLKGIYFSSPIAVRDKIYFTNCAGTTTVIRCSQHYTVLAENVLPEGIYSTLVPVDNQLFIRTKNTLYCIGETEVNIMGMNREDD